MKEVLICSLSFPKVLAPKPGPKSRMIFHQLSGLLRRNQRSFSVAKFMQMLILHFYTIVSPGTRNNTTGLDIYISCLFPLLQTWSPNDLIPNWKVKWWTSLAHKQNLSRKWSNPGGFQVKNPEILVGGWTNPFEKYESNWIISPGIGVKIKNNWNHHLVSEIIYSQNSFEIWSPKRMRQEENLWNHQQDTNHTAFELPFFVKILESKKNIVNTFASEIWTPNTWNGGPKSRE